MSSSTGNTNWTEFLQYVGKNQNLQDLNEDTSLQPGESYPVAPHPYMVNAYKDATLNQVTSLLTTKISTATTANQKAFGKEKTLQN